MSSDPARFDGIFMSVASECPDGVPEFLDKVFGFLARKTDFYMEGKEQEGRDMFNKAFDKHLAAAEEARREKRKRFEEMDRKNRERRERERRQDLEDRAKATGQKKKEESGGDGDDGRIQEVTEEEAEAFMKGEEVKKQNGAEKKEEEEAPKAEKDKGRKPNARNGDDLEKYNWGQTLEEVELRVPLPFACKGRDLDVQIKKKALKVQIKGQEAIIDGELCSEIKVEDSTWVLEDKRMLLVNMDKVDKMKWWDRLVTTDEQIKTADVS